MSDALTLDAALRRKFLRACGNLNEIVNELRRTDYPQACLYLTPGTMHLMAGPTHDETTSFYFGTSPDEGHPERILESAEIPSASGGDW